MNKLCDGVFEGGGMRGIGLVGAVARLEKEGYKFRHVAGSSAGAIVASLVAAGYDSEELYQVMKNVDFERFKAPHWRGLGPMGLLLNAGKNFGIYSPDLFENWLADLLARKNVYTFADLPEGKLRVTASDVTDERVLVLPNDLAGFGINPKGFKVATAVRMSMGIPVFYEPYELTDVNGDIHYIVDGGMLANYPVWILDDGSKQLDLPLFGFRFVHHKGRSKSKKPHLLTYLKQIINTIIEANDDECGVIVRGDLQRTIYIDTRVGDTVVGITDFNLPMEKIEGMYHNGYDSCHAFLHTWDLKHWNNAFRR
ncbi:MAG: patatin-like phospholipase family protein [Christensenellaceae bacterium]|jgi:NTE family protein|nr:patatin-like phospholipase family protein [Christensenellaceae bacterium]